MSKFNAVLNGKLLKDLKFDVEVISLKRIKAVYLMHGESRFIV